MALTKVSTPAIKDEAITLAKLLHGDSNSNGKFLRANNAADPTFETIDLTALSASNLTSGTIPDARFPSTLPAISGANLTNLDASDLASGTIPDARFPATLPDVSAANLTNIPAANITGTLPAIDGSNLTGITSTIINGNAANRIIAGSDTSNTLSGQANLTFSNDVLQVSSTTQGLGAKYINTGNEYTNLQFSAARTAARNALGIINAKWNNNTEVAAIYLQAGDDTQNKDDGVITFYTKPSGGNLSASMVINPNGNVTNARQAAMSFNNATNRSDFGTSYNNDPINFGTVQVNKGGMAASNSISRMTVPTAGVYLITAMISGSGNGTAPGDGMQLNLYRNGSVYPEDQAFPITSTSGSSGEEWEINFSILANASANDYFEVAMSNVDTNNYITTERGNFQLTLLH